MRTLAFIRGFEVAMAREEPGYVAFPMSGPTAALLIHGEHVRATAAGAGSRGGSTVGHTFRASLKRCRALGCPIDTDHPAVAAAAPSAKAAGGRRSTAATTPLKVMAHMETVAAMEPAALAAELQRAGLKCTDFGVRLLRFYARSLLLAALTSARVQDAVRTQFFSDEHYPDTVVRGFCEISKDSEPMQLYAPALGVLGALVWLPEHLSSIGECGQAFPYWEGDYGSKSNPARASSLVAAGGGAAASVATKGQVRDALFAVLRSPPLGWSDEERRAHGMTAHSLHGSLSDYARFIGEFPEAPFPLPPPLRRGFTRTEVRELGHWLRDKNEPDDVPPSARGSGPAAPPGARPQRGAMEDGYTRGDGRIGERGSQLQVRTRLLQYLAAAVRAAAAGWMQMPIAGPAAWALLASDGPGEIATG